MTGNLFGRACSNGAEGLDYAFVSENLILAVWRLRKAVTHQQHGVSGRQLDTVRARLRSDRATQRRSGQGNLLDRSVSSAIDQGRRHTGAGQLQRPPAQLPEDEREVEACLVLWILMPEAQAEELQGRPGVRGGITLPAPIVRLNERRDR